MTVGEIKQNFRLNVLLFLGAFLFLDIALLMSKDLFLYLTKIQVNIVLGTSIITLIVGLLAGLFIVSFYFAFKAVKYERRLQKKLNKNLRTMRIKDYF